MKVFLGIISWIYTMVIAIRHRLYDWGVFKSHTFDIPIICVGNITVGGTGKTPMVEHLIATLSSDYRIAVLSRGYGRRTKGYREVQTTDSYLDVGDEPLQMKLKSPESIIVVSEDRVAGIERIRKEHPDVTLIIMDDGFQHRKVKAKVNIILIDSTRPIDSDRMMPLGRLRDLRSRLSAAHIFVVTKCSAEMTPLDKRLWHNKLRTVAYQKVYFSRIESHRVCPLFNFDDREEVNYGRQAILLSGIGNPRPFVRDVEVRFNVVDKMLFGDHHSFTANDMRRLYAKLQHHPRAIIIMTEKDAVRLRRSKLPEPLMRAMYFLPISMELVEGPDTDLHGTIIAEIKHETKKRGAKK